MAKKKIVIDTNATFLGWYKNGGKAILSDHKGEMASITIKKGLSLKKSAPDVARSVRATSVWVCRLGMPNSSRREWLERQAEIQKRDAERKKLGLPEEPKRKPVFHWVKGEEDYLLGLNSDVTDTKRYLSYALSVGQDRPVPGAHLYEVGGEVYRNLAGLGQAHPEIVEGMAKAPFSGKRRDKMMVACENVAAIAVGGVKYRFKQN